MLAPPLQLVLTTTAFIPFSRTPTFSDFFRKTGRQIRNALDIPNSMLSHHLGHLRNVGLIHHQKEKIMLYIQEFFVFADI